MKPALRRILRDEHTLQIGVHPAKAVVLTGLTGPVRRWIALLDGTRDLRQVLRAASAAGLDEPMARALLDQLTARRVLHDASAGHVSLRGLSLAERDRLEPDVDALDLASPGSDGGSAVFRARRRARVRVYGAGRVGAQIVALLASCGVGDIRVFDPGPVRPRDLTPGGLTWSELGLSRQDGAVAVARRLTSGGVPPGPATNGAPVEHNAPAATGGSTPTPIPRRRAPRPRPHPKHSHSTTVSPLARPEGTASPSLQPHDHPPSASGGVRPPSASSDVHAPSAPSDVHPCPTRAERNPWPVRDHVRPAPIVTPPAPPGTPSALVQAGGPYLGDGTHRPHLVILAPVEPLDFVLVNELAELGIPHLLASAFEGHGSVGPLVLPGRTVCLHCLDLTRRDRDPGWAMVTARLGGYPPGEIACDTTLATVVAAAAAGHALAHLDGRPSAVTNCTVDVTPDGRWGSTSWTRHPECRCMRNNPHSLRMVVSPKSD
ncbi:thiamine biosynthesis protein ThiF [Nonomuraea sp. NPDC050691]|uniref:thiamine biosynthesis protein ThiF n=1 Tax=Nonomuraea sp. NPDC050691 TaxID=3155661 RepID=UPI0033F2D712